MIAEEKVREGRNKWVWPRPLTFEEFLEEFGPKDFVELIDGVAVEREMVQIDHERLSRWLYMVLGLFVQKRDLGEMFASRIAVQINRFRGRLPDLLFVSKERREILQPKAIYGPPDLIIEIISPNDRRSQVVALEADYRNIGVDEIIFLDQRRRRVRALRRHDGEYAEEVLTEGEVVLRSLGGVRLELGWLFDEPRPDELATLEALLSE